MNSSLLGALILSTRVVEALDFDPLMPMVFVDPQDASPSPGQSLTVSVKAYNLTDNFYITNTEWLPGDYLGPVVVGGRLNYSLGRIYGFDLKFRWDPTLLEYVSHSVKIPVEDNPGGFLHEPIIDIMDTVDEANGEYRLAQSSQKPAPVFNTPGTNATIFTMTFDVVKEGFALLDLYDVQLVTLKRPLETHRPEIPHLVYDGQIRTPLAATRIESIKAGAKVGQELLEPVILGEDADVRITVRNDGDIVDNYTATMSFDGTPVVDGTWINRTLSPGESETLNYTLLSADLTRGNHTIRVDATITHGNETILDHLSKRLTVINTPNLIISGSTRGVPGQAVTFDGTSSTHGDPAGSIKNYTWSLTEPGGTQPRYFYEGGNMIHTLDRNAKNGTWTVTLTVLDSWDVEYNSLRPATDPYMKTMTFEVGLPEPPNPFSIENIVLVLILVAIIGLAAFYLYRRSR